MHNRKWWAIVIVLQIYSRLFKIIAWQAILKHLLVAGGGLQRARERSSRGLNVFIEIFLGI